jgi:hypothetical protein
MKLNLFIEELFKMAKLDDKIADEKYKDLFAVNADIDDTLVSEIKAKVIPIQSAYDMPKIQAHHVGRYLEGGEKRIKALIEASGLDESEINEILAEGKFIERIEKFYEKVKAKANDTKPLEGAQKKNAELNAELEELKKTHIHKSELEKIQAAWNSEREDSALSNYINNFKWSESFAQDFRLPLFKLALGKKLEEIGAKTIFDPATKSFKLVDKSQENLEFFDKSNKKITFDDISKDIALENKFVATTAPNPGTPPATVQQTTTTTKNNVVDKSFEDAINKFKIQ